MYVYLASLFRIVLTVSSRWIDEIEIGLVVRSLSVPA